MMIFPVSPLRMPAAWSHFCWPSGRSVYLLKSKKGDWKVSTFFDGGGAGGGGGGGGVSFSGSQIRCPSTAPRAPPKMAPPAAAPATSSLDASLTPSATPTPAPVPPSTAPITPPPAAQPSHFRASIVAHPVLPIAAASPRAPTRFQFSMIPSLLRPPSPRGRALGTPRWKNRQGDLVLQGFHRSIDD